MTIVISYRLFQLSKNLLSKYTIITNEQKKLRKWVYLKIYFFSGTEQLLLQLSILNAGTPLKQTEIVIDAYQTDLMNEE